VNMHKVDLNVETARASALPAPPRQAGTPPTPTGPGPAARARPRYAFDHDPTVVLQSEPAAQSRRADTVFRRPPRPPGGGAETPLRTPVAAGRRPPGSAWRVAAAGPGGAVGGHPSPFGAGDYSLPPLPASAGRAPLGAGAWVTPDRRGPGNHAPGVAFSPQQRSVLSPAPTPAAVKGAAVDWMTDSPCAPAPRPPRVRGPRRATCPLSVVSS